MNPRVHEKGAAERLLPVHIAARHLRCSGRTVRRYITTGRLRAVRVNRRAWGIRITDVTDLRKLKVNQCFSFN
jgi:excisionase family DNA binding protein